MKTKFILPIIALGLFAACSDDNSTTTGPDPDPQGESTESSASIEPESSSATEPTSAAIEESSSSSSVEMAYKYYGAELTGVDQFKYGRFEARMKMVSFPGTVSSMFLNYDDSWMRKEKPWNEIDIEVIGKSATKWQSNILTREGDPDIGDLTATEKLHEITDVTENFHLFAIIWTPEYVAWEIDSVEVRRVEKGVENGSHADKDQVAFLTEEESLRFNLWASKTPAWTGKFTGKELADGPKVQWIDYVRVYKYVENSKTFELEWQDDFDGDALDKTHWTTGNWEMENTWHSPKNVVVEEGYCKLLMTRVLEPVK